MSNITQEVIFPGTGLDWDSDERFIDPGSSPYRLNIMISGDYANGILTNILGNSLSIDISDHKLILSLTYVTVASYYNRLTRKCYYWVFSQPYNSGGGVYIYDNRLMCYNEDLKTLDLIFIDTKNWFGLSLNTTFKDSSMLGDWLYFNPKVSEPKMIDVVRAYNYTNYSVYSASSTYKYGDKVTFYGGLFVAIASVSAGQTPITNPTKWNRTGDSYREESDLTFDSEFEYAFNVLKMPPVERPIISYGSDTYISANNVRGKMFRFSYRYKYFDNTYSSYSAFSDVSLPEDDELYNGEILDTITTNNYIKVTFNPHSPALVKEVEIVVQETSGDWKRVKVINRQEQAQLATFDMSFNFYNNESYITVTDIEVATIESYVPQRANSMEIINKNILAFGGCLEGHDNIPKDEIGVSLTPVLTPIETTSVPGTTLKNVYTASPALIVKVYNTATTPATIGQRIDIGSWYPGGVVDHTQLIVTIDGNTVSHYFATGENVSKSNYLLVVTNFISDNFPAYHVSNTGNYVYMWSAYGSTHFADITQFLFCTVGATSAQLTKKRGFKTGANHPFCIYYYDENMRRWDAQTSKENTHIFGLEMHGTTVYVPMFCQESPPTDSLFYRWTIDWEVYHLPPAGAKYWRWGYAGNSLCSSMIQYTISSIINSVSAEGENMCKIDITPLQTLKSVVTPTWNQYPMSVINPYTWTKGDRIRFITEAVVSAPGATITNIIDGVYEYEILKQDDKENTIYVQLFDFASASIGENTLVEIYTPLKSVPDVKTLYYEFGDIMPIIPDSAGIMVHAGQNGLHNQDFALSHTAMGTFDGGDVYHIMRAPSKPINTSLPSKGFFHESMWYSDFYNSDDFDRGKIGFETTFGQRFLNIVRYSRPYFQNTEINGLSTFEEDDANGWAGYKEYNDIFGNIIAICEFGDTLKVYQERKPSSTLVGRTEYMDSQGQVNVAISTVVLGAIRYDKSNYSTVFPESISRNNDFIYGFDIYNGVAWRDGNNGIFPISGRYATAENNNDYKMQTYFKLKAKALMESGKDHVSVLTVWDEEYKLIYYIFKDSVIQDNNETIVFHQPSNRWITFASFEQTPAEGFNTPLELTYEIVKGFENGIGYSFNEETRFAHFDIGGGLGTTAQTPVAAPSLPIKITMPVPSISSSPFVTPSDMGLAITNPPPSLIHVSWITASMGSWGWTAIQYGESVKKSVSLTIVGDGIAEGDGIAWLDSFPSWIDVKKASTGPLDIGTVLVDTDIIYIYPNSENIADLRTGIVVIKDSFGNTKNITITQAGPLVNPIVIIAVNPYQSPSGLMLLPGNNEGHATVGSNIVSVTFAVDDPTKFTGQTYTLYYSVVRNGVQDVTGQFVPDIQDEISNTRLITLNSNAIVGEHIIVNLATVPYPSTTIVTNANISPTKLPIVITLPVPTISVSRVAVSNDTMVWTAVHYGLTNKITSNVTFIGGGRAWLRSFPSWLTVIDNTRGNTIELDDTISNGDTIAIYPNDANTLYTPRTGYVRLSDTAGDVCLIQVTQQASLANASVTAQMNPTDTSGTTLSAVSGTGTNGSRNISITFTPDEPHLGYGRAFDLDYQIWKNAVQVGAGNLFNLLNREANTKALIMSNPASAGDIIIVYLNEP